MADIVIPKKINLDYLGEGHEGSYITFRAMPVGKYTAFVAKAEKAGSNQKATELMVEALAEQFVEGKFGEQTMGSEDVEKFDPENILKFFQVLTGQADPKEESSSTTPSSTEPQPQTNSSDTNTGESSA